MRAGGSRTSSTSCERPASSARAEQAAERLSEYAAAGVQRIMLNHELFDDLEMLEVLAAEVFPKVEDPG